MIDHERYPTNLVYTQNYIYQLEGYKQQLDDNELELFGEKTAVHVFECCVDGKRELRAKAESARTSG